MLSVIESLVEIDHTGKLLMIKEKKDKKFLNWTNTGSVYNNFSFLTS